MANYICSNCSKPKNTDEHPPVGAERWLPASNICPDCQGKDKPDPLDLGENVLNGLGEE